MKTVPFFRLLSYLHISLEIGDPDVNYRIQNGMRIVNIPLQPEDLFKRSDLCAQSAQIVCHEIGHLLVAPPSRRDLHDYGIPPGSRGAPYWDLDDERANMVEIDLCRRLDVQLRNDRGFDPTHGDHRKGAHGRWWKTIGKKLVRTAWTRSQGNWNPKYSADWAVP